MKKYVTFMAMFAALRTLQRCVRGRTVHILTVLACEWGRVGSDMVYTPPPPPPPILCFSLSTKRFCRLSSFSITGALSNLFLIFVLHFMKDIKK